MDLGGRVREYFFGTTTKRQVRADMAMYEEFFADEPEFLEHKLDLMNELAITSIRFGKYIPNILTGLAVVVSIANNHPAYEMFAVSEGYRLVASVFFNYTHRMQQEVFHEQIRYDLEQHRKKNPWEKEV